MASLATGLVSLDEYLHTRYRPDCDFVDGVVEERSLGEFDHGRTTGLLFAWFLTREAEWGVIPVVEQRIRVAEDRVRVADVCVLRQDAPVEQVTETAPLLCIEVLSPEDRMSRTAKVMEDYRRMGVENLWVVDPLKQAGFTCDAEGIHALTGGRFEIAGTPLFLDLEALFSRLRPTSR